jgi:hypothetical protein
MKSGGGLEPLTISGRWEGVYIQYVTKNSTGEHNRWLEMTCLVDGVD